MRKLWRFLSVKRRWRIPHWHDVAHRAEHSAHFLYMGLVAIETNYYYRYAAGAIVVITVISFFIHEGEGE